jgi:small-conductance mechanosensitive channel
VSWSEILGWLQQAAAFELFSIGETPIAASTVIVFAAILGAAHLIGRLLERGMGRFFARRGVSDAGTIGGTRRLLRYIVMIAGIAVALDAIGVNLATLFTAGAVFAVAIGFAMQNILQNFVSGVILLAERTIKIGDVLEVDGRIVRVENMGVRTTVVRTRDEENLIVPNSILVQTNVKNFTLADSLYRLRANVGVSYGSDMALVEKTLQECAAALDWRKKSHDPVVLLRRFGSSSVDFEVSVWIDIPWRSPRLLSELHKAVWWALKEQGIVIAFAQVDVHFDKPVVEGVRQLATAS